MLTALIVALAAAGAWVLAHLVLSGSAPMLPHVRRDEVIYEE